MTMPRAKRMTDAELFAEGERILAQDQSQFEWTRVKKEPHPNPPITIRMSGSLVKRLDRLAKAQHRTRANLVQYVLWEYVCAQDGLPDGKTAKPKAPAAPKKTAARAAAGKSAPRKRRTAA